MTPRWTHACLPCNAVWSGAHRHVHGEQPEYRRGFWTYRLHRALMTETWETAAQLVEYPVSRGELDRLLGRVP